MKQVDLEPRDYRKRDTATGRWLQNVDRKFCRWYGLFAVAVVLLVAGQSYVSGDTSGTLSTLFGLVFGFAAGGLITMSLRVFDW